MSPHMVAILLFGTVAPLSAQNLNRASQASESSSKSEVFQTTVAPGHYEVPATEKAPGNVPDADPVYAAQDALTLAPRSTRQQEVESVVDLDVLRAPSPYRKVATSTQGQPYEISADTLQTGLALISAVYRESGRRDAATDCLAVALSVEQRIKLDVARVLEIVESEVTANPTCACEIVKMAITASDADVELVVSIVETSINAAPDSMRIISQCAIAAMPESIAAVQALLAKLDPNSGDAAAESSKSAKSAKGAKDAEVASIESPAPPNPLDLPPGGPPNIPIVINPVTEVNPN